MNRFKQQIYTWFAEQEAKDNTNIVANDSTIENNLNKPQDPKKVKSGDITASKKLSPKSKKRLIIWGTIGILFSVSLALILWDTFRQTETKVTRINTIEQVDQAKGVYRLNYNTEKGVEQLEFAKDVGIFSYYLTSGGHYKLLIPRARELPLAINLKVIQDASNNWTVNMLNLTFDSKPVVNPPATPEEIATRKAQQGFYTDIINPAISSNWSPQPVPFNWWGLILSLLPLLLFVVLGVMLFKNMNKMQGGGQDGIFSMGKSGAQIATSNTKFSDVAGIKEEKEELSEIVDYLKSPQKYVAMGARTPKGVILYGPPGTGKTLLAKAVAGEAGVSFFQISGSQFEDMLVGVGAKRVRNLFADARKAAPAIIFIDEIDSVASKRGKNEFGGGLADQTINQLLAEMDGFNTSTGIVVIAATNRLDVLDDAILRPGRFDRHIQINLPDIREREEIIKIHARNKNISKKVSLYDIARRTPGFSGAQLENVLNEATLLAVRNRETMLTTKDIDEAIDRVIAGPAKKSRVITPGERKLIAYHEAGHAIVGLYTPGTDVVQKITIIPRGSAAGYTLQTPEGIEKRIQSKEDLLSMIRMTLGGRAAEEIVFGKDQITTGASNDLYKITNVVRAMVMQLGMSEIGMTQFFPSEGFVNPYQQQKLYSETKAQEIDKKIEEIIQTEYTNAKNIITENRKELDLIVETLLITETILKEDIDYIHKHKKLPPSAIEEKLQQEAEIKKERLERKSNPKNKEAEVDSDDEFDVKQETDKPKKSTDQKKPSSTTQKDKSKKSNNQKKQTSTIQKDSDDKKDKPKKSTDQKKPSSNKQNDFDDQKDKPKKS